MAFTSPTSVINYLPSAGPPGALTNDLLNPLTTASGSFGGEVVTLTLNVDFTSAGLTGGTSGIALGDLTLCGFTTLTALNGTTVDQFLVDLNTLLGGGSATYSISQLAPVVVSLNTSFLFGTPSTFAQTNLVNGACPPQERLDESQHVAMVPVDRGAGHQRGERGSVAPCVHADPSPPPQAPPDNQKIVCQL